MMSIHCMTLNVTSCRRKRQIDESVKSAEMRKDPVKEAGKEREGEDRARGPEKGGSGGGELFIVCFCMMCTCPLRTVSYSCLFQWAATFVTDRSICPLSFPFLPPCRFQIPE